MSLVTGVRCEEIGRADTLDAVAAGGSSNGGMRMRTIDDAWGPEQPELEGLLGGEVPWRFWTPEVIRAVAGAEHCAMPPLPYRGASLWRRVEAWGPLLPLLHFHLGWPRVDIGLSRWAATGFDSMEDPTLEFIRNQWGRGLAGFVLWSAETSGAPEPSPLGEGVLAELRATAQASDVANPSGLHLENHWSLDATGHWSGPNDSPSPRMEWRKRSSAER